MELLVLKLKWSLNDARPEEINERDHTKIQPVSTNFREYKFKTAIVIYFKETYFNISR